VVVIGVVVEATEGGKKGMPLGLGLLEVHLFERLLVETSFRLMLTGGILTLVLALARVMLVGEALVLVGAVGDKVVRAAVASFL
jgi:hypothetical protein